MRERVREAGASRGRRQPSARPERERRAASARLPVVLVPGAIAQRAADRPSGDCAFDARRHGPTTGDEPTAEPSVRDAKAREVEIVLEQSTSARAPIDD